MKIIGFIPARCGSVSIPLKNIKDFCGKPLIYWSLHAMQHTEEIDEIYVATDCREIMDIVESFKFSKVQIYERDQENARDTSSTESVMLEFLEKHQFESSDIFILLQLTTPFTRPDDLKKAIAKYTQKRYDSLLSCVRVKQFFWNEDGIPINYEYKSRPRRQEFSGQLLENGAFYINRVGNIKESLNRLSGNIGIYEMPEYSWIQLDEEFDWPVAEALMKRHLISATPPSKEKIKLFMMDVDGVLTDGGMYYSEMGDELKRFNTQDGKGIELLRNMGIKTAIITSENTKITTRRAEKLKVDYIYQGVRDKLAIAESICAKEKISLLEASFIGDDVNDLELLQKVSLAACPANAVKSVKEIPGILHLSAQGGDGAVRELIEYIFAKPVNKKGIQKP